ncbi:MAG: zinc-binding dehydrogenase [Nitrospinae bacterium]|nr:zinc-binding dehydrogenase [Nitrospinota bacterium]
MKALFVVPGPTGAVNEFRDIPVPTPGLGEVLIAVRAAGTNRGELLARPLLRSDNPAAKPMRAGIECAGEIVALQAGVSEWKAGDRIMARAAGTYAEYVVAQQRALMRIPEGMTWAEAAAIPNVYVTAHDALVSNAAVKPGESVLVTAGSSGVGTAAIQIARALGAHPVLATTRSAAKGGALRALGAHDIIDTSTPNWTESVLTATGQRGVDAIIDQVGGPMLAANIRVLAIKGRLVSVGRNAGRVGECDLDEVARKRASIIGVTFRTRTPEEALVCSERFAAHLLGAFATGALKPVLDRTFPFERIADAHAYMLSDAQIGKIVVTMQDDTRLNAR